MRTIPWNQSRVGLNIKRLVTITCGDRVIRFTDNTSNLVVGGNTFIARAGVEFGPYEFPSNGDISNGSLKIVTGSNSPFTRGEIAAGLFGEATLTLELIDTGAISSGTLVLQSGILGDAAEEILRRRVDLKQRGLMAYGKGLQEWRHTPYCQNEFGDNGCRAGGTDFTPDIARSQAYVVKDDAESIGDYAGRVRIDTDDLPADYHDVWFECTTAGTTAGSAPSYDDTIGNTTTDGTAVFTAHDSWIRAAVIDMVLDPFNVTLTALPDARANVDGFYTEGKLIIRSGDNAGRVIPIANWTFGSLQVTTMFSIFGLLTGGEQVEIVKGCALSEAACQFYDNILNRFGFLFLPGRNAAITTI